VEFERWFREKSRLFELLLLRAVVLFLCLLLAAQVLQAIPQTRKVLSLVDRLEGVPYVPPGEEVGVRSKTGGEEHYLVLQATRTEGSLLEVLVNKQPVANFNDTHIVTVKVKQGDLVEIDGDLPSQEIAVVVSSVSSDLISPVRGKTVVFNGVLEVVGTVGMAAD
jgi:hypothetical protein